MSDAEAVPGPKSLKKLNLSHAGVAGGVVAAMMMLQPVKDFFYTREEGRSTEQRIEKVEVALTTLSRDLRDGQKDIADQMRVALSEQDRRMESRFLSLENSFTKNIELLLRREAISTKQSSGGK